MAIPLFRPLLWWPMTYCLTRCWKWKLVISIIILGQQVKIVLTKLWYMLPYSFWSLVPSCLQSYRAATWLLPFLNFSFSWILPCSISLSTPAHETETIILFKILMTPLSTSCCFTKEASFRTRHELLGGGSFKTSHILEPLNAFQSHAKEILATPLHLL